MKKKLLCALLSALLLASCANGTVNGGADEDKNNTVNSTTEVNSLGRENILKVSAAEPEKVAVDEKFVDILADFSEKLYVKASETNSGNLIFSPLSSRRTSRTRRIQP